MKKYIKCAVVPFAICVVVAAIMAGVNYVTAPVIEEASKAAATASLTAVLPEATGFEQLELPADAPESVQAVYKDEGGSGYAVLISISSQYSQSPMTFTLGIGTDGLIKGVELTNYAETKDFGADYPQSYVGQDSALGGVDLVGGITYSSTAFRDGVNDAFTVLFAVGDVAEGEKSEDQIAAEAAVSLIPAAVNNAGSVTVEACELPEGTDGSVSAVYATENNTGYFVNINGTFYVMNAFGEQVGCILAEDGSETTGDEASVTVAAEMVAKIRESVSEPAVTKIGKIYPDSEITSLDLAGLNSTVTGAYRIQTAEGESLFGFTAEPYGYGGVVSVLYIVKEDGTICKFKVLSHNETEYYGSAVAEGGYTAGYEDQSLDTIGEDVVTVAGCTFTTNAVKTALADVTAALETAKEAQ